MHLNSVYMQSPVNTSMLAGLCIIIHFSADRDNPFGLVSALSSYGTGRVAAIQINRHVYQCCGGTVSAYLQICDI